MTALEAAATIHDCQQSNASCGDVVDVLEGVFGVPFALWLADGHSWSPDGSSVENHDLAAFDWESLLALHYRAERPVVTSLPDDRAAVIVPIVHQNAAAVGITAARDRDLLERLAATAVKLLKERRQREDQATRLDEYLEQATAQYEELCWLHRLSEHIDDCDVDRNLTHVAAAVLPTLVDLIKAESIALIGAEKLLRERTRNGEELAVFHAGATTIPDEACFEVVKRLGERARIQPVVLNHLADDPYLCQFPGLRSCVLVPVARDQQQFGWILALNKRLTCDAFAGLSEGEFGTIEAGLLTAASAMLATHARNVQMFRDNEDLMLGVVRSLINSIDARDPYTCGHSDRVASIAKSVAAELNLNEATRRATYLAGLLHDIGKIGVSDAALRKPGELTDGEHEEIKRHPEIGHEILKHIKQLKHVLPGVLGHHESFDGTGYPKQLAAEDIPLVARVLAVADAYDAMTSSRPYRLAMPSAKAQAILLAGAGRQWDVQVVEAFFRILKDVRAVCRDSSQHTAVLLGNEDGRQDAPQQDDLAQAVATATRH